jgi:plastocyanin
MRRERVMLLGGFVVAVVGCTHETSAPRPSASELDLTSPARRAGPPMGMVAITGKVKTTPYKVIEDAGAVVYLADGPRVPGKGMAARIDNEDMDFVPFITVITAGGTVTFGNTDPIAHNAFSPDNGGWDVGEIPSNGALHRTFDKPEIDSVLCNLHKNMLAYVVVSPSSYFTKTDAEGRYALYVPPGSYKVTAWSPRLSPETQPVTAHAHVTLNFALGR